MKYEIPKPYITHENVAGSITPHPYSCALRAGASANYILINNERRPTERELLRLQGFPEDFKIVVPYSAFVSKPVTVAVPVIAAVARQMKKLLMSMKGIYVMAGGERISRERAKAALDNLIRISRIHFYKPIQIAEIYTTKDVSTHLEFIG